MGIILSACGGVRRCQPVKQETSAKEVEIVSVLEAPVIISDLTGENFTSYLGIILLIQALCLLRCLLQVIQVLICTF